MMFCKLKKKNNNSKRIMNIIYSANRVKKILASAHCGVVLSASHAIGTSIQILVRFGHFVRTGSKTYTPAPRIYNIYEFIILYLQADYTCSYYYCAFVLVRPVRAAFVIIYKSQRQLYTGKFLATSREKIVRAGGRRPAATCVRGDVNGLVISRTREKHATA